MTDSFKRHRRPLNTHFCSSYWTYRRRHKRRDTEATPLPYSLLGDSEIRVESKRNFLYNDRSTRILERALKTRESRKSSSGTFRAFHVVCCFDRSALSGLPRQKHSACTALPCCLAWTKLLFFGQLEFLWRKPFGYSVARFKDSRWAICRVVKCSRCSTRSLW